MTHPHDLRLLVQQESERIAESKPDELDLSVVQAHGGAGPHPLLLLLAESHEQQASDAERRGDGEQAMGWFADAMRLRDLITVLTLIEIPCPAQAGGGDRVGPLDELESRGGPLAA
jgi:hypothetical protein